MTIVPLILSPHPKRIGRRRSHRLGRGFSSGGGGGCRSTKGRGGHDSRFGRREGLLQGAGLPPGRGSKVRARPSSRRGEAAAAARGSACARPAAAHRRRPPAGPGIRPQVPAAPGRGSSSSSGRPALWLQGRAERHQGGRSGWLWCLDAAPGDAWQRVSAPLAPHLSPSTSPAPSPGPGLPSRHCRAQARSHTR